MAKIWTNPMEIFLICASKFEKWNEGDALERVTDVYQVGSPSNLNLIGNKRTGWPRIGRIFWPNWTNIYLTRPRGIEQWIKNLPATQVAGVRSRTRPNSFSAPILSGTLPYAMSLSLSLSMHVIMHSSVNTCQGGGKKRGIVIKS